MQLFSLHLIDTNENALHLSPQKAFHLQFAQVQELLSSQENVAGGPKIASRTVHSGSSSDQFCSEERVRSFIQPEVRSVVEGALAVSPIKGAWPADRTDFFPNS
jgi:hypothetical protein